MNLLTKTTDVTRNRKARLAVRLQMRRPQPNPTAKTNRATIPGAPAVAVSLKSETASGNVPRKPQALRRACIKSISARISDQLTHQYSVNTCRSDASQQVPGKKAADQILAFVLYELRTQDATAKPELVYPEGHASESTRPSGSGDPPGNSPGPQGLWRRSSLFAHCPCRKFPLR